MEKQKKTSMILKCKLYSSSITVHGHIQSVLISKHYLNPALKQRGMDHPGAEFQVLDVSVQYFLHILPSPSSNVIIIPGILLTLCLSMAKGASPPAHCASPSSSWAPSVHTRLSEENTRSWHYSHSRALSQHTSGFQCPSQPSICKLFLLSSF